MQPAEQAPGGGVLRPERAAQGAAGGSWLDQLDQPVRRARRPPPETGDGGNGGSNDVDQKAIGGDADKVIDITAQKSTASADGGSNTNGSFSATQTANPSTSTSSHDEQTGHWSRR